MLFDGLDAEEWTVAWCFLAGGSVFALAILDLLSEVVVGVVVKTSARNATKVMKSSKAGTAFESLRFPEGMVESPTSLLSSSKRVSSLMNGLE